MVDRTDEAIGEPAEIGPGHGDDHIHQPFAIWLDLPHKYRLDDHPGTEKQAAREHANQQHQPPMEIGGNDWASLHWYCLDSETRSRSIVDGPAAVGCSSGVCSSTGPRRDSYRNGNIPYHLRDRNPVRHTFT